MLYQHGIGVDKDFAQAKAWWEKAAKKNEPNAITALREINFTESSLSPSVLHSVQRAHDKSIGILIQNWQKKSKGISLSEINCFKKLFCLRGNYIVYLMCIYFISS